MAFQQRLECDRIEETSFFWQLPLLALKLVGPNRLHEQYLAEKVFSKGLDDDCQRSLGRLTQSSTSTKWYPCLPTIEETPKPIPKMIEIKTPMDEPSLLDGPDYSSTAAKVFSRALSAAYEFLTLSNQTNTLMDAFSSVSTVFLPHELR